MNNHPPSPAYCYSCGRQTQPGTKLQRQQYPICNEKSDLITIEKHSMCLQCVNGFRSVKQFAKKFDLKWFNKDFFIEKIIDTKLLKFSHLESSFIKQNKRKSDLFSSIYSEAQQMYDRPTSTKLLQLNLPNDIYSFIILDHIEKQDLHYMYWLPKTVLYFIHLTQTQKMRPQQRRQRVKKTLQGLSYLYCVDTNDIKYLAVIIHTLYCSMDEETLIKIMQRLLRGVVQNSMPLELFFVSQVYEVEKSSSEDRLSHKKPIQFRPDNLLHVIYSIFVLLDFFKDGKLHRHVSQIVHLSHDELLRSRQERLNEPSYKTIQRVFENYLKSNITEHSSKSSRISHSAYQQLVGLKRQRNQLDLIIKTIKKQQQENQQIVKQMQTKFKKQKDQYINKIVKLNNHIETLQLQIKSLKQNMNGKQNNLQIKVSDDFEDIKSNPEMKINQKQQVNPKELMTERTADVMLGQQNDNQNKSSDKKKYKSEIEVPKQIHSNQSSTQQPVTYLKSILQVTDIIQFNQTKSVRKSKKQPISSSFPLPQIPQTLKQLSQLIITQINELQKKVSFLMTENKKLKQQSTRLLAILKRKEQSWLPLLHEKDQIIGLYEKALICLQKGYVLPEEPLSSRIQSIVDKVSSVEFVRLQAQDDVSVRDTSSIANSIVDDLPEQLLSPQFTLQRQSTSQKKVPRKQKQRRNSIKHKSFFQSKIKKKEKAKKQTQCQIF